MGILLPRRDFAWTTPRQCDAVPKLHHRTNLAQRPERRPNFRRKDLRLFPRREVAALVDLIEVDEVFVGSLYPGARRTPEFAGEDRESRGNADLSFVGGARVFPVEPSSGGPSVGDPVKCDVVEDRVSRE